jgi:hypothetical protein
VGRIFLILAVLLLLYAAARMGGKAFIDWLYRPPAQLAQMEFKQGEFLVLRHHIIDANTRTCKGKKPRVWQASSNAFALGSRVQFTDRNGLIHKVLIVDQPGGESRTTIIIFLSEKEVGDFLKNCEDEVVFAAAIEK